MAVATFRTAPQLLQYWFVFGFGVPHFLQLSKLSPRADHTRNDQA